MLSLRYTDPLLGLLAGVDGEMVDPHRGLDGQHADVERVLVLRVEHVGEHRLQYGQSLRLLCDTQPSAAHRVAEDDVRLVLGDQALNRRSARRGLRLAIKRDELERVLRTPNVPTAAAVGPFDHCLQNPLVVDQLRDAEVGDEADLDLSGHRGGCGRARRRSSARRRFFTTGREHAPQAAADNHRCPGNAGKLEELAATQRRTGRNDLFRPAILVVNTHNDPFPRFRTLPGQTPPFARFMPGVSGALPS